MVFLNKSEASYHLHTLYDTFIKANGLPDQHPNFYSLINENIRNPLSPSAIEKGYPRGNKGKYATIPHIRVGNQPTFFKSKLQAWFDLHYAPKMLKAA